MSREHHYDLHIVWTGNRGQGTSGYPAYSRDHEVRAAGKPALAGSSDPAFRGDPGRYSPEDLLVAALSSCHMLWYLHLCADSGIVVEEYMDAATGTMVETEDGGGTFQQVVLRPRVVVREGTDTALALSLHERAHALCFIANSINFDIRCQPDLSVAAGPPFRQETER